MGKVERIYIANKKREKVKLLDFATLEAGKGIVGDRYHRRHLLGVCPDGSQAGGQAVAAA